jgi:hypothetical protein
MEEGRASANAITDAGSKHMKEPPFRSLLIKLIFFKKDCLRPLLSFDGHVRGLVTDQARLQLRIQMTRDGVFSTISGPLKQNQQHL